MAARQILGLNSLTRNLLKFAKQNAVKGRNLNCIHPKSTFSALPGDNCKVELALTSDGRTTVCYHPLAEFPYEHSKPIPRPDPLENHEETHDQVLKARLNEEVLQNKQAPTIEELSKMFYTTKHRWYPVGQYHRRRKKSDPPKDR
ncbi:39S ribosomal protein L42, mitochondrial-like [Polyodon spathula]|uniref:39S ribosomal protein L42, mitochondrial-like n=1 Tax=Polyodon spathula TaxID=7913 RepID=UPI001B7E8D6D|nr:39S ribosomal protein L42, mitochondrial-like [Polyodon spathula]